MNALLDNLRSDMRHVCQVETPPTNFTATPNVGAESYSAHTNWLRHRAIMHGDWTTPAICSKECNGLAGTQEPVSLSRKQRFMLTRALRLYAATLPHFRAGNARDAVEHELEGLLELLDTQ